MPSQVVVALALACDCRACPRGSSWLRVGSVTNNFPAIACCSCRPSASSGALVCAAGAACCNVRTTDVTADTDALASAAAALFRLLGALWRLAVGVAAAATAGCPCSSARSLSSSRLSRHTVSTESQLLTAIAQEAGELTNEAWMDHSAYR
ncbi:hypothetical protein BC831DRAFT_262648 [Entophlyctis helioformis]|nr:hypothetical protein BC831DRAFT_262648 [Entophlyctis helioformis]